MIDFDPRFSRGEDEVLTRARAKELCNNMWTELARTGADQKPYNNLSAGCACCEFHLVSENSACGPNCLIQWKETYCTSGGSEYSRWEASKTTGQRKYWARRIAKLAQKIDVEE